MKFTEVIQNAFGFGMILLIVVGVVIIFSSIPPYR